MYSVDYEARFKESYNGETSDEIKVQQDAEAKEDRRPIKRSGSSYRFLFPWMDFCGTSAPVHVKNAP